MPNIKKVLKFIAGFLVIPCFLGIIIAGVKYSDTPLGQVILSGVVALPILAMCFVIGCIMATD